MNKPRRLLRNSVLAAAALPLYACSSTEARRDPTELIAAISCTSTTETFTEDGGGWRDVDTGLHGRYRNLGVDILSKINGQPRLGEQYTGIDCEIVLEVELGPTIAREGGSINGVESTFVPSRVESGNPGDIWEGYQIVIDGTAPSLKGARLVIDNSGL